MMVCAWLRYGNFPNSVWPVIQTGALPVPADRRYIECNADDQVQIHWCGTAQEGAEEKTRSAIAEFRCQRVRADGFEFYCCGDRSPLRVRFEFASGLKNYWMTRQNSGLVSAKKENFSSPLRLMLIVVSIKLIEYRVSQYESNSQQP